MLSISAFNALLKIIEEPPKHLLFILATTELHKVPATILSRCQRFSFRRISQEDIAARLQYVAYEENIDLDDSAARILARLADGGMRDGLSLLDQCASATEGELNAEKVYACLGIAGIQECGKLMEYIAAKDSAGALDVLNRLYANGKDMGALLDELACLTRDFMILKTAPQAGISMLSGVVSDQETKNLAQRFSTGQLARMMNLIQKTLQGFTRSASRRMDAELCVLNLCQPELDTDMDALLSRLTLIEDKINSGVFTVNAQSVPTAVVHEEKQSADVADETAPVLDEAEPPVVNEAPIGFWPDIVAAVQSETNTPATGLFSTSPESPVKGVLQGNQLKLICANDFARDIVNKSDIIELVARKASAKLGRQILVTVETKQAGVHNGRMMEQLLDFGRTHADRINIKES